MKKILIIETMLFILLLLSWTARAADICTDAVQTGQGMFSGLTEENFPACVYRGIPFAKPPVGERRLKRPEPPDPHGGVFKADMFGPACPQEEDFLNGGKADVYSEDCLYLNVWRPAKSGKFPVMVWIYGGGFVGGSGSFGIYSGAHLASREDVVIVTLNYRLAALGFLALPELMQEDKKHGTGNYGLLDQVRALEWVRDNIEAFGGDRHNVMVFGQSAGGMSVAALLASPEARGLFHKAMIMSGPSRLMTSLDQGYAKSRALAKKLGCEGPELLACLRAKPTEAFNMKTGNDMFNGGVAWSPTVDGSFLLDFPVKAVQSGNYNKVPVIISTTRDELRIYTMFIPGLGAWPRSMVSELMKLLTGPNYEQIMSMYSYKDFRRPVDLALAFGINMVFETPMFMMAEAMVKDNPVYVYRFDWDQTRFPHKMGAFHAVDVPFVFGALNLDAELAKLMATKKTIEKAAPLGYTMMDYVTNFAKTGNPNGGNLPHWPAYTLEKRERLYVNVAITSRPLTEQEIKRFRWYEQRELKDVLTGTAASAGAWQKIKRLKNKTDG